LIEGDYNSGDEEAEEDSEVCLTRTSSLMLQGEAAKAMKKENRSRDLRRAQEAAQKKRNDQALREMLDEQSGQSEVLFRRKLIGQRFAENTMP
jgi:hypothetical protein